MTSTSTICVDDTDSLSKTGIIASSSSRVFKGSIELGSSSSYHSGFKGPTAVAASSASASASSPTFRRGSSARPEPRAAPVIQQFVTVPVVAVGFCGDCGDKYPDSPSKFCPSCGGPIRTIVANSSFSDVSYELRSLAMTAVKRELTQAERDAAETARIELARQQREALLMGNLAAPPSPATLVRLAIVLFAQHHCCFLITW